MNDLIDFMAALAAGEFDSKHLYRMGYPTLYDIEHSREKGVFLEMKSNQSLPDGSQTPSLAVGVNNEYYGTEKQNPSVYQAGSVLEKIFMHERVDIHQLKRDFQKAFFRAEKGSRACPVLKELVDQGKFIIYGVYQEQHFVVGVSPNSEENIKGVAYLSYLNSIEMPIDKILAETSYIQ